MPRSTLPSRLRAVLYVAASEDAAHDGAAALEAVETGPERTVHPATTVERVANWAPEVDCVVFAETPTTAAGSQLLEVIEACGSTPVVLFTDASYAPTAARSTDGIEGYVRRDTDDAVAHLADEIEWICRGDESAASGRGDDPTDVSRSLETLADLVSCQKGDRERCYELLVDAAVDLLETDYCWLSTVRFGEFVPRATSAAVPDEDLAALPREGALEETLRTGEATLIDDVADDGPAPPFDGVRSLCLVPVGDVGVLQAAAEESGAFDDDDRDRLEGCSRVAVAVLERLEREADAATERDRLREERTRLAAERDQLEDEVDELEAERDRLEDELDQLEDERDRLEDERARAIDERDRLRTLFANVPEPAVRYEIDGGRAIVRDVNDTFEAAFAVDRETAVGAPVDEYTVPAGLEERRATLTDALRTGERRQLVSRRETVDGVREFLLTLVPLEADVDGTDGRDRNPEGLIVYSDVTEANRRERELTAARERLATIAELVEEEVRSPLNVARGYLELAEETGDREHFAEVEDAQDRVRDRIEQLVAIARRDEVLVETEPVAICDVARRAWIAVETGDAALDTEDDRVLEADKARLRELLEHLFRAVLEDAELGTGGTGADGDGAADESSTVTVGATDDGFHVTRRDPGAPERDDLETTPVPGQLAAADGTGFELGTIERIADAHGWDVSVAEDDHSTSFVVRGVDAADVDGN